MKFDFKFGASDGCASEKGSLLLLVGNFWQKIYKYVFFACLVASVLLGIYMWQRSLSNGAWSLEKKQEFLDSQNKSIVLRESDYKNALADVEARRNENLDEFVELKDIFKE